MSGLIQLKFIFITYKVYINNQFPFILRFTVLHMIEGMLISKKLVKEKRPWEILNGRFGLILEVTYITCAHIPLAKSSVLWPNLPQGRLGCIV